MAEQPNSQLTVDSDWLESLLRNQFEPEDDPTCQREHFDEDVRRAAEAINARFEAAIGEDIIPEVIPHYSPYISGVNGTKREARDRWYKGVK